MWEMNHVEIMSKSSIHVSVHAQIWILGLKPVTLAGFSILCLTSLDVSLTFSQLERVLFGGGSVLLGQCTGEVAHFSLQWWTEPSSLKHQSNPEGESILISQ